MRRPLLPAPSALARHVVALAAFAVAAPGCVVMHLGAGPVAAPPTGGGAEAMISAGPGIRLGSGRGLQSHHGIGGQLDQVDGLVLVGRYGADYVETTPADGWPYRVGPRLTLRDVTEQGELSVGLRIAFFAWHDDDSQGWTGQGLELGVDQTIATGAERPRWIVSLSIVADAWMRM